MDDPSRQLLKTIKPEPIGYILLIVLGLLITPPMLSILRRGPSAILPVIIITGIVWLFIGTFIFWILFQKITLFTDRLVFRENFAVRELPYADIAKVELLQQMASVRGGRVPTYILNFYRFSNDKPFSVIPKPYSLKDLSMMLSIIHTVAPQAQNNDLAQQMAIGTFRP